MQDEWWPFLCPNWQILRSLKVALSKQQCQQWYLARPNEVWPSLVKISKTRGRLTNINTEALWWRWCFRYRSPNFRAAVHVHLNVCKARWSVPRSRLPNRQVFRQDLLTNGRTRHFFSQPSHGEPETTTTWDSHRPHHRARRDLLLAIWHVCVHLEHSLYYAVW